MNLQLHLLKQKLYQRVENKEEEYMHRGVANRTFARGFNLSDDVIVDGVNFNNGLLTIYLQKVVPDHQALKVYDIE